MRKLMYIALILISFQSFGQDPQFSQYYSAPMYLNPGFAGSTYDSRAIVNTRIQWPELPQAFTTYAFSYEKYVDDINSGIGVLVTTDKMSSASWQTTFAGILYSYKVRLSNKWVFSPGLYFAYGKNSIDRTKLVLRDGIEYDGVSLDPDINKTDGSAFFDFSAGTVLYSKNTWIGVSAYHMNKPNTSLLGNEDRLAVKWNVHGGVRINLYHGMRKVDRHTYLTPSFVYKRQGELFEQLDVGLQYHIDPVAIGVWYRGIPIKDAFKNETEAQSVVQQDALVFNMAFLLDFIQIGYSYDFSISKLQTTTGGSHEISLVYEFETPHSRERMKKKDKLLPCPSFQRKEAFWAR